MKSAIISIAATLIASAAVASPEIIANVDISKQEMVVIVDGEKLHTWPVSTAREGKETPLGIYDVEWLSAKHKSSLYNGAPMPWSIFYDGDYAIHGTTAIDKLGSPASAGCVRLHPDNAKVLFKMVTKAGYDSLKIVVGDSTFSQ